MKSIRVATAPIAAAVFLVAASLSCTSEETPPPSNFGEPGFAQGVVGEGDLIFAAMRIRLEPDRQVLFTILDIGEPCVPAELGSVEFDPSVGWYMISVMQSPVSSGPMTRLS